MKGAITIREANGPLKEFLSPLTRPVTSAGLLDLARRFAVTYKELARTSTEHFLTTPVTALPTGKETGRFLTIDVGGTNLRVGFIELLGEDGVEEHVRWQPPSKIRRSCEKAWPIGEHMKMDQAEDLFEWIGDCIAEVIGDAIEEGGREGEKGFGEEVPLGITFSFPMA
jgi:hexokinase